MIIFTGEDDDDGDGGVGDDVDASSGSTTAATSTSSRPGSSSSGGGERKLKPWKWKEDLGLVFKLMGSLEKVHTTFCHYCHPLLYYDDDYYYYYYYHLISPMKDRPSLTFILPMSFVPTMIFSSPLPPATTTTTMNQLEKDKASTGPVGNLNLLRAVDRLNSRIGDNGSTIVVRGRYLFGTGLKKSKGQIPVSR